MQRGDRELRNFVCVCEIQVVLAFQAQVRELDASLDRRDLVGRFPRLDKIEFDLK